MHIELSNNFSDHILTFGGFYRQNLKSVEVHHNLGYSNNTTCQIQDLPNRIEFHSGVKTKLGVVYCGGRVVGRSVKECYQLNAENKSWVPYKSLKNNRDHFTMNEINETLLCIGGYNAERSLEYINLETGKEWKEKKTRFFD